MKKDDKYTGPMKTLNIENFKYRTHLTEKFQTRKAYEPKDPKLVLAFIPGTILKVNVKAGDTVKAGQLLLTLDAMKMKNRILSPGEGTVKKVNAEIGSIVAKNQVLIELE